MRTTTAVIGGLNMDLSVRVGRLPAPGETVSGQDAARDAGGKGGNQAVAAARLGSAVRLIGMLGPDGFGSELRNRLVAEGVDDRAVGTADEAATGLALIVVQADGENTITLAPGANHRLDGLDQAGRAALDGADSLLIQLEIPVEAALAAARRARSLGIRTILNAAPLREAADTMRDLLRTVDVLVVNETEAAGLLGTSAPITEPDQARALLAAGPRLAVVTLGAAGALAVGFADAPEEGGAAEGPAAWREPGFRVTAVDTVGAGDAFCAEFAVALGSGAPVGDALRRACAAGALATTRSGAQSALPTRAEVDAFLASAGTGTDTDTDTDTSADALTPAQEGVHAH